MVVAAVMLAEADMPVEGPDTLVECAAVRHFEAVARSAGVSDFVAE
jgi:hypothetical protein